jgi:hypothetical protein
MFTGSPAVKVTTGHGNTTARTGQKKCKTSCCWTPGYGCAKQRACACHEGESA